MRLQCLCSQYHDVDESPTDDVERERRLTAAADWSRYHKGPGHDLYMPGMTKPPHQPNRAERRAEARDQHNSPRKGTR